MLLLVLLPLAAFAQIRGSVNPAPDPSKPHPVRNDVAQPEQEIVTLRNFHIKKGTFPEFLKASQEEVWPYFEKIGSRIVGMWQVFDPEGVSNKDYDEVYLMTRYASVEHWRATRMRSRSAAMGRIGEVPATGSTSVRAYHLHHRDLYERRDAGQQAVLYAGIEESFEKKP